MDNPSLQLYAELGARPVINALGNRTMLGGSTPSDAVRQAMHLADRYYVDMDEFFKCTGQRVAELLECDAALITPGCAAALVLGTAACMTGDDPTKMAQLPNTDDLKNEVVIQQGQRYKYERVVRMPGAQIVGAGSASGTTPDQLAAAIGPNTLALLYPAHAEGEGFVSVRQAIDIAHQHTIPIIIDAAFYVYPLDGLKKFAAWGADLVGYGAKYFGAPNSTGLLCGRPDLIEAARLHSFASFEKNELMGFGRPLKVDRQEVVAVVYALREWLAMDHEVRNAEAGRRALALRQQLASIPHLGFSADAPASPSLSVTLDENACGKTAATVAAQLQDGNPSIWLYVHNNTLNFSMYTTTDGDEAVIAACLREVLG